MKRSEMAKKMAEYWLGLFPNENPYDAAFMEELGESMGYLLDFVEHKGMEPPKHPTEGWNVEELTPTGNVDHKRHFINKWEKE